jgi:hypothetical protein
MLPLTLGLPLRVDVCVSLRLTLGDCVTLPLGLALELAVTLPVSLGLFEGVVE